MSWIDNLEQRIIISKLQNSKDWFYDTLGIAEDRITEFKNNQKELT
jgi:hypothetical protein